MKFESKAVHAGDRKKPGQFTPVVTPIYAAVSYAYDKMEQLDRVFAEEEPGPSYGRHDNPTTSGLEELINTLENGHGTVACSSGMAALHLAITAALLDRRKTVLAASAIYGATMNLLTKIMEPMGVETSFVDMCDLAAVEKAVASQRPGCLVMETISNPLLRVAEIDELARIAKSRGAALLVDNTFASPMLVRPIELGASFSVHSTTKYLSGHGDALGGAIVSDVEHAPIVRTLSRTMGPILGPFESYLTMRGIKTLALRMERQCANSVLVAEWLAAQTGVAHVYATSDPKHPDAATIGRLFPENLLGAIISFELKDAGRDEVFAFMDKLKMIVRVTSLGDVHTMALYPAMSSHRDLAPKQRQRLGIGDNLIRLSVGIEAVDDIIADLAQAFE